jgi:DNA-binding transcriptional LysR family regulator
MKAQIEHWDDLRYFLAVARAHSLSGAARSLRVNHSTVFRRIAALEEQLGSRLFERLARGYELTAVGEEMLVIATRIEDDVLTLDRQVLGRDRQLSGSVRVTTVDEVLEPIASSLGEFRAKYPGIQLEVNTDMQVLSLSRREADVALRPGGKPTEPDVIGRRLCDLVSSLYASRSYLARRPAPRRLGDLASHDLVTFDDARSHIVTHRWLMQHAGPERIAFRGGTMIALRTAIRAGLGIGVLPTFMCDPDPELVRVLKPIDEGKYGLWLLMHSDLRQTCRVRAFVEFIAEVIEKRRKSFEGAGQKVRA